jgi:hypothetical protein
VIAPFNHPPSWHGLEGSGNSSVTLALSLPDRDPLFFMVDHPRLWHYTSQPNYHSMIPGIVPQSRIRL